MSEKFSMILEGSKMSGNFQDDSVQKCQEMDWLKSKNFRIFSGINEFWHFDFGSITGHFHIYVTKKCRVFKNTDIFRHFCI